jgi:hypothetical protein
MLLTAYVVGTLSAAAVLIVYAAGQSRLSAATRILLLVIGWPLAVAYAGLVAAWWLTSLGGRRRPFDL